MSNPQRAAGSPERGYGAWLAVAVLITSMVALSIAGSAYWRPEPRSRTTLELGGATPVRLSPPAATDSIAGVLELVAPTVAFITMPDLARSGSGVVVHPAGFVVTNAHVVDGAERVRVAFENGDEYDGEVYGIDLATDLAVVKVATDETMPTAALGDSDALQVGEFVIALGAPFGLEATATTGIVSGLHRSGLGIARFEDFIVTDAPINRGNSGGPLVNLRGEVVGINTAIIAGNGDDARNMGTFAGIGFAIPVNVMRVVAQRLIGDGGLAPPAAAVDEDAGTVSDTAPAADGVLRVSGQGSGAGAIGRHAMSAGMAARTLQFRGAGGGTRPPPEASVGFVQTWGDGGAVLNRGTGFVVVAGATTYVVTNEHVVRGARDIVVFFPDRSERGWFGLPASVLVTDGALDLALLTVVDDTRLTPLRLGDAGRAAVGDRVVSVGAQENGGAVEVAESAGALTGVDVRSPGLPARALILATDIDVRLGHSGGPLMDEAGSVIAVVVARATDESSGHADRRSFAVALRLTQELEVLISSANDRGFDPGFMPVFPRDEEDNYIAVLTVDPDGLAARYGLERGDWIYSIDGQSVPGDERAQRAMFGAFLRLPPGTVVDVVVARPGGDPERFTIPWEVPDRPPSPARAPSP